MLSLIRDYYCRFRLLVHEIAKFGVVGIIGSLVQFAIQTPLHLKLGLGAVTSQFIAIVVAIAVTYVGNRYWAFKHRKTDNIAREGATFFVLAGVGTGIQLGITAIGTYGLGMKDGVSYSLITVVGIGVATVFRLIAYRQFVFRAQPASVEAETLDTQQVGPGI